jgi:hypothetical protein
LGDAAEQRLAKHQFQVITVNVVLLTLAVVAAWGRFGPYSF